MLGFGCDDEAGGGARAGAVGGERVAGSLMPSDSDAGGPTGTIRDPNSTPMVTSCYGRGSVRPVGVRVLPPYLGRETPFAKSDG